MANYLAAWKTFRRLGNEPQATAAHVLARARWPAEDDVRVLDIGCGDGRMLEAFLLQAGRRIATATLLDPDPTLLDEAARELGGLGLSVEVRAEVGVADRQGLELAENHDVGLGIHLVYLMAHNRFRALVNHWPVDKPLYIVLDAPDSVFTELWSETAPDFALRAKQVHRYLSGEANGKLSVTRSDFITRVANPFDLPAPIRNLVLSLLCYCDFDELGETGQEKVEAVINSHTRDGHVECACACYELVRSP
jgi:SAM-dependent methyltransferase